MPQMTKREGDAIATANVPDDAVDVWKAAGWKVAPEPKPARKAKGEE
jgi:hypothetical protein